MLVSNIISLQVVSIWNKSFEGIVENVLFDRKTNKAKFFKIYNENTNETYLLNPTEIYSLSKTTILIKNNTLLNPEVNLELCAKNCLNPVGASLYNFDGVEKGIITDLQLDSKFKITNVFCCEKAFPISNIFILGENISFLKPNKNIKLSTFAPKKKIKISKTNIAVKSLDFSNSNNQNIEIKPAERAIEVIPEEKTPPNHSPQTSPKRIITDYRFLINRVLIDNIVLSNGEILIHKNSRINSKLIEKARTFGKLIELTQKSRIN